MRRLLRVLVFGFVATAGCREATLTATVGGPPAASAAGPASSRSSRPESRRSPRLADAPATGASSGVLSVRPSQPPSAEAWQSPEQCQRALRFRPARQPGVARVGTWNIRWFPDGGPGKTPHATRATDLAWLACAIATLDVDLLAVQEFKTHARARAATRELLGLLDRFTGGAWQIELDDCPNVAGQHVGLLYDGRRVQRLSGRRFDALNPHGEACKNQLRPGQGGYFRFPGGLDLHVVSVHLKSGTQRRSLDLRRRTLDAFPEVRRSVRSDAPDDDLLILGDFNTMGCSACTPSISAAEEIDSVDRYLESVGFRRVEPDRDCSEYYRGRGGLLDHLVVSESMAEAPRWKARVAGYCRADACSAVHGAMPPAYERLSDHCPLVAEFVDRDLD